jgi:hypothetical protein
MKLQYVGPIAGLIASLALVVSSLAFGQSTDAQYCYKLSVLSRQVVAGGTTPPADVPVAVSKCESDPAGSIPVLERYLKANKFTLPARD